MIISILNFVRVPQSGALGTRRKFLLKRLNLNVISDTVYFRDIILESLRNVSEITQLYVNQFSRAYKTNVQINAFRNEMPYRNAMPSIKARGRYFNHVGTHIQLRTQIIYILLKVGII